MPRCLDPGSDFELCLESDEVKPADERPTFRFRVLSMREWDDANSVEGGRIDAVKALLSSACVGWSNMIDRQGREIPYAVGVSDITTLLDHAESIELLDKLQVTYLDKKKLPSTPPSTADNSAATAAAANA